MSRNVLWGGLIRLIRRVLTLQDSRFNAEVDLITGYKTHSILCLPIKNHRDEVSVNQTRANPTLRRADAAPSCVGSGCFLSSTETRIQKPA